MSTTHSKVIAVFVLAAMGICTFSTAQQEMETRIEMSDRAPTKEEVIKLLFPRSFDMPSKREVENMNIVKSLGSDVFPILAEIMTERDDPLDVNRVLAVASQIDGDKSPLLRELPALLKKTHPRTKIHAIKAFQRWGDVHDCKYILPLVSDEEEEVRLHAIRALGYLGDRGVANELETILDRRNGLLDARTRETDLTLKHGYRAISNIIQREDAVVREDAVIRRTRPANENGFPDDVKE